MGILSWGQTSQDSQVPPEETEFQDGSGWRSWVGIWWHLPAPAGPSQSTGHSIVFRWVWNMLREETPQPLWAWTRLFSRGPAMVPEKWARTDAEEVPPGHEGELHPCAEPQWLSFSLSGSSMDSLYPCCAPEGSREGPCAWTPPFASCSLGTATGFACKPSLLQHFHSPLAPWALIFGAVLSILIKHFISQQGEVENSFDTEETEDQFGRPSHCSTSLLVLTGTWKKLT